MIPNSLANNPYMDQPSVLSHQPLHSATTPAYYRSYNTGIDYIPSPPPIIQNRTEHLYSPSAASLNHLQNTTQLNIRVNKLSSQLNFLQKQNNELRKQADLYLNTIQKLKVLNTDQQDVINQLNNYREQSGGYSQALNQRNLALNNQIQNMLLEREMLVTKMTSEEMMRGNELESLSYRLAERDHQNFELKKRLSAVTDVKMRLESDIASLKFSYQNVKNKAELELRQRAFRLEQNQKSLNDSIRNKEQQIRYLLDKIRNLQDNLRRQKENQTLLLTKIADQSRLYPDSSSIKSANKQNDRDRQNQSNRLINLLEQKDRRLSEKDKQLHNMQNQIKNLEYKMQTSESAMQAMSKLNEKRLKEMGEQNNNESSVPNMVKTVERLRMSIVELVFEVYVHSVDVADKKKSNSLVLFMTNMNQFLEREGRQLKISIEAYDDTKKSIEHHLNSKATSSDIKSLLTSSLGKFSIEDNVVRDKMNKWIEGTIVYTVEQKRIDKSDKNKEILFLFRLLTIKYRIVYPIKGQEIKVDGDLHAILENKIVGALRYFVIKGSSRE